MILVNSPKGLRERVPKGEAASVTCASVSCGGLEKGPFFMLRRVVGEEEGFKSSERSTRALEKGSIWQDRRRAGQCRFLGLGEV
ncbi:hypothetical protein QG37_02304 [Candidozyma auris]|nr:hypothetical protein QG37_02304 [[Candida] auris]